MDRYPNQSNSKVPWCYFPLIFLRFIDLIDIYITCGGWCLSELFGYQLFTPRYLFELLLSDGTFLLCLWVFVAVRDNACCYDVFLTKAERYVSMHIILFTAKKHAFGCITVDKLLNYPPCYAKVSSLFSIVVFYFVNFVATLIMHNFEWDAHIDMRFSINNFRLRWALFDMLVTFYTTLFCFTISKGVYKKGRFLNFMLLPKNWLNIVAEGWGKLSMRHPSWLEI